MLPGKSKNKSRHKMIPEKSKKKQENVCQIALTNNHVGMNTFSHTSSVTRSENIFKASISDLLSRRNKQYSRPTLIRNTNLQFSKQSTFTALCDDDLIGQ